MLKFREYCSIVDQLDEDRKADDAYYKSQGWDGDPQTRDFFVDTYKNKAATTEWTVMKAVEDILGSDVAVKWANVRPPKGKQFKPGKIYIMPSLIVGNRQSFFPEMSLLQKKRTTQWCYLHS